MDVAELRRFYTLRRTDFLIAITAIVGVVTTTVLVGLVIAVLLSLVSLLYRASRPYVAVLVGAPGAGRDVCRREPPPGWAARPGSVDPPARRPALLLQRERGPERDPAPAPAAQPEADWCSSSTSGRPPTSTRRRPTCSASSMTRLRDERIELFLAQVKGSVRDRMGRAGLMELVGEDQLFRSVAAAVAAAGTAAAGRSSDPSSDSSPLP